MLSTPLENYKFLKGWRSISFDVCWLHCKNKIIITYIYGCTFTFNYHLQNSHHNTSARVASINDLNANEMGPRAVDNQYSFV